MSAFKQLRDVSSNFEANLRQLSAELFTAKIGESFDETLCKKLEDISLLRSKLTLLRAEPIANDPLTAERIENEESTIKAYEDTASTKVLEQLAVKNLTQSNAVQKLFTTPAHLLHPEIQKRKEEICAAANEFCHQESQLMQLNAVLKEKQEELASLREKWDGELSELRDMRDGGDDSMEVEPGPLRKRLRMVVQKLEDMRWLISKLVTSRTGRYDWLADPARRIRMLKITREENTIDKFMHD